MFISVLATSFLCLGLSLEVVASSQKAFPPSDCPDFGSWYGEQKSKDIIDIEAELGPTLSSGATVLLPDDNAFADETVRWSIYSAPTFRAVVQVTTEQDVQAVICWANKYDIPFLPAGGGHGIHKQLGTIRNGVEISFAKMKEISISEDGDSATLGAGLHSGEVVRGLFAENKRTTTGACLCTGIMGPLLGGGHGLLQGQHGLLADQLIEARMVLADGSLITVSNTENEDLFWGVRGAGHNFGVLTSVKVKIYDQPPRNWTYFTKVSPGTAVQEVFKASEELNKDVPPELTSFIVIRRIPHFDPNNAIILSSFYYDGPPGELVRYTARWESVPQITNRTATGNYEDIYVLGGNHEASPMCVPNNYKNVFGVELNNVDPATEQQVYDLFNAVTADPRLANGNIVFESYGRQAVVDVLEDSTAIPYRKFAVDVTPQLIYNDPTIIGQAVEKGKEIRNLIQSQAEGPLNTYVNYAFGDESLEAIYGYDSWRVEKLRRLKEQYDPQGRFNHFAPITFQ